MAELERKIDALHATLNATKNQTIAGSEEDSSDEERIDEASRPFESVQRVDTSHPRQAASPWLHQPSQPTMVGTAAMAGPATNGRKRPRSSISDEHSPQTPTLHYPKAESSTTLGAIQRDTGIAPAPTNMPLVDPSLSMHEHADVIDRQILDVNAATKFFDHYNNNMVRHYPCVVFPPGTLAATIRRTKPALFLAILSIASGYFDPNLQKFLLREASSLYADSIICKGDRSLDLIQALQVSSIWYSPSQEQKESKVFQFIHMAAVMAITLGFGVGKAPLHLRGRADGIWRYNSALKKDGNWDPADLELRRAWLSCYLLCGK